MRVVIDTNVIIAGLYSRKGASFQILKSALNNRLEYAISPLIVLEYVGKIEDKVKDGLLNLPIEYYLKIAKTLIQNGIQISRPIINRPTLPDNSDDKILECAIAGQCNIILTFNIKDFPKNIIEQFNLIAMTTGEFIKSGGLNEHNV